MPGVTANPDNFPLPAGTSQDVVYTFTDVPADESITEVFNFSTGLSIPATLTLPAPNPSSESFNVPAGVIRELLSIDDTQAVIRYSRP